MKRLFTKQFYVAIMSTFMLALVQAAVWAQDTGVTSTSTTIKTSETSSVTIQPWMWVVGGAIVLIIIIALARGGSSEKVVVSKEERTERL